MDDDRCCYSRSSAPASAFSYSDSRKPSYAFVGRILDGITGGNISTAQAYIADVTTEETAPKEWD